MTVKFLSHISPAGNHVYDEREYPGAVYTVGEAGQLYVREPGKNWDGEIWSAYIPGNLLALYAAGVWERVV